MRRSGRTVLGYDKVTNMRAFALECWATTLCQARGWSWEGISATAITSDECSDHSRVWLAVYSLLGHKYTK